MLYMDGECELSVEKITIILEKYINEDEHDIDWDELDSIIDKLDSYHANVINRLITSFEDYVNYGRKEDYLVSLRNFLIVFQTDIQINNQEWIDNNEYGLLINPRGRIYATISTPAYIEDKFVKEAFQLEQKKEKKSSYSYNLIANPYIKQLTGYENYNSESQKLSLIGMLNTPYGWSSMAVLPTGAGKSLITQAIAYYSDGLTIVIVPTVSLALDQQISAINAIKHITNNEIFCYSSGATNKDAIIAAIKNHSAKLLFISPEALIQNEEFAEAVAKVNEAGYLKNLVIDEAHIVVEWGDYFRTDYQTLEPWRKRLLEKNPSLRTFLLSATIDRNTGKMLRKMFSEGDNWLEFRCDALRKEPRYCVVKCSSSRQKKQRIIELIKKMPHPLIVYTLRPERAEEIKKWILNEGLYLVETYTGETSRYDRDILLRKWKENEFDIMVATAAFGMGVDKPDVRTVIHEFVPDSANLFYQELGRGGRDGNPCLSILCIYPEIDFDITNRSKVLKATTIQGRWNSMYSSPKSIRKKDIVSIDTDIKPTYNLNYIYDKASSKDITWNIYILLLFRRYDLIDILDVQYHKEEDRYTYEIRIKDDRLQIQNDDTIALFESIREKEKKRFEKEFSVIKQGILNSERICFSEMFMSTYPRVSEYCAGCNYHKSVISDDIDRFELHNKLSEHVFTTASNSPFEKQSLIISNDLIKVLPQLFKLGVTIVVTDNAEVDKLVVQMETPKNLLILSFAEYRQLVIEKQYYYLYGECCVIMDEDIFNAQFARFQKEMIPNQKKIYIMDEDYEYLYSNKRASVFIGNTITNEELEELIDNV